MRERVGALLGTRQGAWLIKHIVEPLDRFCYKLSGGRVVLANVMMPTLMLASTGAKSGLPRTTPVLYLRDGRRFVLVASNYGSASHPAWYHNLRANPACSVTVGGRTTACQAREAEGAEREQLWQRAVAFYPGYRSYQSRTGGRRIPVMLLEPTA
jgi:deazaflavin-dependent oxidoreductase (nitroreductase family)